LADDAPGDRRLESTGFDAARLEALIAAQPLEGRARGGSVGAAVPSSRDALDFGAPEGILPAVGDGDRPREKRYFRPTAAAEGTAPTLRSLADGHWQERSTGRRDRGRPWCHRHFDRNVETNGEAASAALVWSAVRVSLEDGVPHGDAIRGTTSFSGGRRMPNRFTVRSRLRTTAPSQQFCCDGD
jgi:hypothetical protein